MQEKSLGMREKRIGWLDISRGILIILMVIGHSTGLFNNYIYQFHMAAFFFLSGYVANPEGKSFFRTLFDKFFTILLPVISTVLLGLCILWLLHFGHYDVLLSIWEFPGWNQALVSLFVYGDIYVDVLGAEWFLIILFGICVLNKLIHMLTNKSLTAYLIFALALYVAGYGSIKSGNSPHIGMFSIDLVFIGNLFYTIGYCIQKTEIFERIAKSKAMWKILLAISIIFSFLISRYMHIKVDWPSRAFERPIPEGLCALNGIILVFTASLFMECLLKRLGGILAYIGKNTMGILLLHFIFFKVMYLPFYWFGIIKMEDLSRIVPEQMSTLALERQYWLIVAIGAIVLSLFTWKLLLCSKILDFLLGQGKHTYMYIWNMLATTQKTIRMPMAIETFISRVCRTRLYSSIIHNSKLSFWLSVLLLVSIIAITSHEAEVGSSLQDCLKQYGYYEDGWVEKSSQFLIKTGEEGRIDIEIYCPSDSLYDKKVDVYINNNLAKTVEIQESLQVISVDAEPNQVVQLVLETNFIQEDTGADKRELAMIVALMEGR